MSFGDRIQFGERGVKSLGRVLARVLKGKRFYEKKRYGALVEAWRQTVGEEVAAHTRISRFDHGRLTVEVDTPILMHELTGFLRSAILQQIQSAPGGEDVADLRFRLGGSMSQ